MPLSLNPIKTFSTRMEKSKIKISKRFGISIVQTFLNFKEKLIY